MFWSIKIVSLYKDNKSIQLKQKSHIKNTCEHDFLSWVLFLFFELRVFYLKNNYTSQL